MSNEIKKDCMPFLVPAIVVRLFSYHVQKEKQSTSGGRRKCAGAWL